MQSGSRFVFLTGTGRCGSSLVQEVLARHPDIGFLSNLEDRVGGAPALGRMNSALYARVPQSLTRKGRLRFAPSEGYQVLQRRVSPQLVTPGRPLGAGDATPWLRDRVASFFHERAAQQGRPVFLHKFTGWPRCGLIDASLSDVRHIHIIRDPRAVVSSLLQMDWWRDWQDPGVERVLGPAAVDRWRASGWSNVVLAALLWAAVLDAHEAARQEVGEERWMEVRYEDIIADPVPMFAAMEAFSGLEPSPAFAEVVAGQTFSSSRAAAYRRDLDPAHIAAIEREVGDRLGRHGYEPDPGSG